MVFDKAFSADPARGGVSSTTLAVLYAPETGTGQFIFAMACKFVTPVKTVQRGAPLLMPIQAA
jgi:hypothetical protein